MRIVYKSLVVRRFGWWVRLYLGGSSAYSTRRRRAWKWDTGMSRGVTFRFRPEQEQVAGIQWRRLNEWDLP